MPKYILGVDEVGRGCLAGDVFTAGVLCPIGEELVPGVKDSKKMSAKQREKAAKALTTHPDIKWVLARRSAEEIDRLGIGVAVKECFLECIQKLLVLYPEVEVVKIVVDGVSLWNPPTYKLSPAFKSIPVEFLPKADATVWAVSAASVIAKVARDHYMAKLALKYPDYGWERNAGYGTPEHLLMLKEKGLTPEHRDKFCRTALRNMGAVVPPPATAESIDIDALFAEINSNFGLE